MSWRASLDAALDAAGEGPVEVTEGGTVAEVDVHRADAVGVRIGRVTLRRSVPRDLASEAQRLARDVRSLPDRLAPVEVDPTLGGATLRTRPEEVRDHAFYELGLHGPAEVTVHKQRIGADGVRQPVPWDTTREQLGRLLEELDG